MTHRFGRKGWKFMSNAELIYFAWVGKSILVFLVLGLAVLFVVAVADMISEWKDEKKEEEKEIPVKDEFFFGEVSLDDEGRITEKVRKDSADKERNG